MSKLMYSELGGFSHFPNGAVPAGWVDGEPIRQKLMDAKANIAKPIEPVTIQPVTPQVEKPRLGRPPKNVVENDLGDRTNNS